MVWQANMHLKRVAVVYPTIYFSTVPSLVATVNLLIENGYRVDLFHCGSQSQSIKSKMFTEYIFKEYFKSGTIGWKVNFIISLISKVYFESRKNKYDVLIGVDAYGLLICGFVGKILRIPYVYFSLEILFSDEIVSSYINYLKKLERYFNKGAFFTITQDIERAELLKKANSLPDNSKIICLPNSGSGECINRKKNFL